MQSDHDSVPVSEVPRGDWSGFRKYFRNDVISGFLVFLIAMPLCLGIALASGFPAIAGVFTAVVGATLTVFISNSELTIKGPAAGLIVIVFGAVTQFGFTGGVDAAADFQAYRMALAVGVVAGLVQIVFGLVRAGVLGDFFPVSVVHGMLAAIGVIIMVKQLPIVVGQSAKGEPIEILRELPEKLYHANPEIAVIGLVSLLILFGFGYWKSVTKNPWVRSLPSQLVVLFAAIPMGLMFDLGHEHTYTFAGQEYRLGEQFLVNVPNNLLQAITTPDWNVFLDPKTQWLALKWVVMFALIGSLESMLSAKAIAMIDPWKRKTNLNRDLIGVGIANTVASMIGGLPMISEIVRSKANIDNGARTRFANFWHGMFLLGFVAFLPALIHRVPLAALAAMLVYTGFRLASPSEFFNVYKIGREQLVIFVATMLAVLLTDILIGIGIGIAVKLTIHLMNGLPLKSIFKPYLEIIEEEGNRVVISARGSAVFSNFIPFRRQIEQLGLEGNNDVVVDFSQTSLVDHSVMEQMHELEDEFERAGRTLEIRGLEGHRQFSDHPLAVRKRGTTRVRRVTIIATPDLEETIAERIASSGATGFTVMPCRGAGRSDLANKKPSLSNHIRFEVIARSKIASEIVDFVSYELPVDARVSVCVETVEVNFAGDY
ncbi:MAG: SulP family inorganic anion transporter [Pirellula sp.]|jgi:MFS superfamily sulfate permease-like transporter|nr:SulP family inorganic anion transporter [Pirellula sp.]